MRDEILKAHPELRRLYGAEPLQSIPVIALFFLRWGMAYALRDSPILLIGLLASTIGCWTVHASGTYAHENAHRLIVSSEPAAMLLDVLIEATITSFGKVVGYQYRHVNFHHLYLGDYDWDSEMRDLCAHVAISDAEILHLLRSRAIQLIEAMLALLPAGGLVAQDVAETLRSRWIVPHVTVSDAQRKERFALPQVSRIPGMLSDP